MTRILCVAWRTVQAAGVAVLLAVMVCGAPSCQFVRYFFTGKRLLTASVSDLKTTVVTPHLQTPIARGTNVLWCGTFQLAWNEVCRLIGEDVHFVEDPPMVAVLNKKAFTRDDLDAESYVAVAGFVRDGIRARIQAELQRKFKGRASPRLLPDMGSSPRWQDITAYAYLFKHLEFATPFEKLDEPLYFQDTRVPAFGMGSEYKPVHKQMCSQVIILDYRSPDDFIIELKTKAVLDRLILAKITPGATLAETIAHVTSRCEETAPTMARDGDILKVPKLNFDLSRSYHEILRRRLVAKNPDVAKDLRLLRADQYIRFQMDEKGVVLESEAVMMFACAAAPAPPPSRHIMIFDKPFLIMLKRERGKSPYFALWVANEELLLH